MPTKNIVSTLRPTDLPFVSRKSAKVVISLPRLCANVLFFIFGTAAWIFKIGDEKTGTILPYSFSQIFLPLVGIFAVILIAYIWRLRIPPFEIRAWSMRLVNVGFTLVLIGTVIQFGRNSDYRLEAVMHFVKWILPWCAILLVFVGLLFGGNRDWLVYGLLFGCLVSVLCVEANRFGVPIPIVKNGAARFGGLLNHSNQYGILLSSLAPFSVYVLHKRGWINRVVGFASFPLFAIGLFECLSKTNIVIWPIVLAIMFLLYSCNNAKKFIRTSVLIGISVVAGVFLIGVALQILDSLQQRDFQRMSQFLEDPTSMRSLDDRQNAWEEAAQYLHESPWLGKGPGWAPDHLMFLHAHNLFLQAWIDVGLLGLLGTGLMALGVLKRSWEVVSSVLTHQVPMDDEARLQIAAAIALVAAIFGNSMSASLTVETLVPFSLLIGLSFASPRITPLVLGENSRKRALALQRLRPPA